jgi:3',5'-cyclic AMP phosphodiesterase CpdA
MAFSFVQVTDHHLTASESVLTRGFSTNYSFRAVMRHIAEHTGGGTESFGPAPSFIVSTGDLGDVDPAAGYRAARRLLGVRREAIRAPGPVTVSLNGTDQTPMYFLPGNHDDETAMARTLFAGSPPHAASGSPDRQNTWFEHEGVRFVFVDWGRRAKASSTPEMFDFLSAALDTGRPAVVLTHHHVAPCGTAWLDEFIADDVERFWDALRGKRVLGVLSGHIHMTTETVVEGIPVLTVRSTCFQFAQQARPLLTLEPPHYRIVMIDGNVLTSKVVEVALGRLRS